MSADPPPSVEWSLARIADALEAVVELLRPVAPQDRCSEVIEGTLGYLYRCRRTRGHEGRHDYSPGEVTA